MAVAATGFFDGVHLGHRQVIDQLCAVARERGEESVIVTFWPHPRSVLQQDADRLRLLTTLQEKKERCLACGVSRSCRSRGNSAACPPRPSSAITWSPASA